VGHAPPREEVTIRTDAEGCKEVYKLSVATLLKCGFLQPTPVLKRAKTFISFSQHSHMSLNLAKLTVEDIIGIILVFAGVVVIVMNLAGVIEGLIGLFALLLGLYLLGILK